MKPTSFFAIALLLACAPVADASDFKKMSLFPAKVEVLNMKPQVLKPGADDSPWAKVPQVLVDHGAAIFTPTKSTNGVADITVKEDGWAILAVNYDYQGNSGGDWKEDVWTSRTLRARGWKPLTEKQAGGLLIKSDGRAQELYYKHLKKGETARIRSNKYDPPYLILLGQVPANPPI